MTDGSDGISVPSFLLPAVTTQDGIPWAVLLFLLPCQQVAAPNHTMFHFCLLRLR